MLERLLREEITQEELLNNYNANISIKNMPYHIKGFVFNYKGINNIIINEKLPYFKKGSTLLHELAHIELNQLCQNDKDLFAFKIDKYEDEADKYINFIKKNIN